MPKRRLTGEDPEAAASRSIADDSPIVGETTPASATPIASHIGVRNAKFRVDCCPAALCPAIVSSFDAEIAHGTVEGCENFRHGHEQLRRYRDSMITNACGEIEKHHHTAFGLLIN